MCGCVCAYLCITLSLSLSLTRPLSLSLTHSLPLSLSLSLSMCVVCVGVIVCVRRERRAFTSFHPRCGVHEDDLHSGNLFIAPSLPVRIDQAVMPTPRGRRPPPSLLSGKGLVAFSKDDGCAWPLGVRMKETDLGGRQVYPRNTCVAHAQRIHRLCMFLRTHAHA